VLWSPELHAGSTRLVEADRNRLLGRCSAVFPFSDVVHLFAHELTGLSARRLALALVATRTFESFLLRHRSILPLRSLHTTMRQKVCVHALDQADNRCMRSGRGDQLEAVRKDMHRRGTLVLEREAGMVLKLLQSEPNHLCCRP
jgi:hypothetical protein